MTVHAYRPGSALPARAALGFNPGNSYCGHSLFSADHTTSRNTAEVTCPICVELLALEVEEQMRTAVHYDNAGWPLCQKGQQFSHLSLTTVMEAVTCTYCKWRLPPGFRP